MFDFLLSADMMVSDPDHMADRQSLLRARRRRHVTTPFPTRVVRKASR